VPHMVCEEVLPIV